MKKLTVNVRRHSISDKTTGEKDYPISEEGTRLALEEGGKIVIPDGGIKFYSSPKRRAIETAEAVSKGAYDANHERLCGEEYTADEARDRLYQLGLGGKVETTIQLDSIVSRITKVPNVKQLAKEMPLNDLINLILRKNPEAMDWAAGEVCGVIGDIALFSVVKGNADKDELVELVSHSPKVEAAFLRMTTYHSDPKVRRHMHIPDVRIEEFGGAFKETEYFSVEIEVGHGTYRLCRLCNKGQEFQLK